MTPKQESYYWRLWGALRKADPKADRKAVHAQLGLPESHVMFSNEHFDKWISHCKAQTDPANFKAQISQVKMPATRKQTFIRQLLAALAKPEEYAESIITRMKRNRKLASTGAGSMLTLETLIPEDLEKLMIALKKEARRRWKTKDELLGEIYALRADNSIDEQTAFTAVSKALCTERVPPLTKLYYEPLLVVLGVLRDLAAGRTPTVTPDPEPAATETEEVEIPF